MYFVGRIPAPRWIRGLQDDRCFCRKSVILERFNVFFYKKLQKSKILHRDSYIKKTYWPAYKTTMKPLCFDYCSTDSGLLGTKWSGILFRECPWSAIRTALRCHLSVPPRCTSRRCPRYDEQKNPVHPKILKILIQTMCTSRRCPRYNEQKSGKSLFSKNRISVFKPPLNDVIN